jgi:TPR repeat protein
VKLIIKILYIFSALTINIYSQIVENSGYLSADLSWGGRVNIEWNQINKCIEGRFGQITKDCSNGVDQAYVDLGFYYLSPFGKHDEILATRNFRIAAEKGNTVAMMMLHHILWNNNIIPSSRTESLMWLSKAEQLNRADAAYQIYLIAKDRENNEFKNIDTIMQLKKAVTLGSIPAKRDLAEILIKNNNQEFVKEAFKLYRDLVINDDKKYNYMLGVIKVFGLDGDKDEGIARKYFMEAGQNHEYALIQLGKIYLFGRGISPDYATAREFFNKALALAKVRAIEFSGIKNFNSSKKTKKEEDLATPASYYLGLMSENGFGVQKNQKEAVRYYKMTKLCPMSYDRLNSLSNGKHKNSLSWWELKFIEEQRIYDKYEYL